MGFTAPGDNADCYMDFTCSMVYFLFCEFILLILPLFHGEYEQEAEADARSDDDSRGK